MPIHIYSKFIVHSKSRREPARTKRLSRKLHSSVKYIHVAQKLVLLYMWTYVCSLVSILPTFDLTFILSFITLLLFCMYRRWKERANKDRKS